MSARNLVVVRCGDQSLHTRWLTGRRNFDIAISYFGQDNTKLFDGASYVHRFQGGKWNGLFNFFCTTDLFKKYDRFWLPDDDIETNGETISNLFDYCEVNNLDIAQPALTMNSYVSHFITVVHPLFEFRYTNFVEIMVPFVTPRVLAKVMPLMETTRSGAGLDFIWGQFYGDLENGCGIIDRYTVRHTRPVGSIMAKSLLREGSSPSEEMDRLFEKVGFEPSRAIKRVLRAKGRMGRNIDHKAELNALLRMSQLVLLCNPTFLRRNRRHLWQRFKAIFGQSGGADP